MSSKCSQQGSGKHFYKVCRLGGVLAGRREGKVPHVTPFVTCHHPQSELPLTLQVLKGKSHLNTQREIRARCVWHHSALKNIEPKNPRLPCSAHPWLLLVPSASELLSLSCSMAEALLSHPCLQHWIVQKLSQRCLLGMSPCQMQRLRTLAPTAIGRWVIICS